MSTATNMTFELLDIQRCTISRHKELDDQQKQFVEQGNTYLRAYNLRNHSSIVEPTLIYLSDYTKIHFVTQEAFMELHNYPGIDKHVAHHNEYVREVAKGIKSLLQYKSTNDMNIHDSLSMNIAMLITDWFEFHLLAADKRLNEFIRYEVNKEQR